MAKIEGIIEAELRASLSTQYVLERTYVFSYFLRGLSLTPPEYKALDPSVTVRCLPSESFVVFMRVRGVLNFWLCTKSDPAAVGARSGAGTLATFEAALRLCDEFLLLGRRIEDLTIAPDFIFDTAEVYGS